MRSTLSSRPHAGFPPVRRKQGWARCRAARFCVAQPRPPIADWVEGSVAASSALRSVASPITGTTLQQLDQVAPGRCVTVCGGGGWPPQTEPFGACVRELARPLSVNVRASVDEACGLVKESHFVQCYRSKFIRGSICETAVSSFCLVPPCRFCPTV